MKHFFLKIRQRWMDYLDRLAKVNEKLYGSKRLDCCDLEDKHRR